MSNTTLRGDCPAPFYDVSKFPDTGGFIDGRFCEDSCCLPCPAVEWLYPESFISINKAAQWLAVISFTVLALTLITYAVLPAQITRRHYLNTCLMISLLILNAGFLVTLGSDPDQCYNEITPNDMYSSDACAWSGAFVLFGGICAVFWVFIRSLSMHLQICWDITPGSKYFYFSQVCGWALPAAFFVAAITASGVSFRFGPATCHINHTNSMADYFVWLLISAGSTIFIQITTFAYCIHVYLRTLWTDEVDLVSQVSDGRAPTFANSHRSQTVRAIYNRLKRIIWLQWRGLAMVITTLVNVVYFSIVFVYLDDNSTITPKNKDIVLEWLGCLEKSGGDPAPCYGYGQTWLVNEATIGALLIMLTSVGTAGFIFMFRLPFITGWGKWLKDRFSKKQEFVSLDAMNPGQHAPWTSEEAIQYHHEQLYANGTKSSAVFEMQNPARYQKEYGDMEDNTTVGSGNVYSPTESATSPPTNAYFQPGWGRPTHETYGSQGPAMVNQDPYVARAASPEMYSQSIQHPNQSTGAQPYVHPNPNIARAQMEAATTRARSTSPGMGYETWNAQSTFARPTSPQHTGYGQPPEHWPMGNAFAQMERRLR